MHAPIKYVEKGLSIAANGAWQVFSRLNRISRNPSHHAEVVRQAAAEVAREDQAAARLAAGDRFALSRPACGKRVRRSSTARVPLETLLNEKVGEIKATILERDGKILMVKDCPIHGHFEDVMAIDTAFFKHLEDVVPGPRHPRPQRREAAQPRQQHHQARPRLGAHGGPHQPLQHDVRPVLHGRQPGRVRPRADVGRHQDGARQRHHHQAAGGRCRCSSRAASRRCRRISSTPSATRESWATTRCRPRPTASSSPRLRLREGGRRGRPPLCLPAVRRHRQRRQLAPPRGQPVRREAAGHREPVQRRRRHRAGHHDRQRRQQRAGRAKSSSSRIDNPKKINFLSFQPVSFTGRDEEITPERRAAQRYTLSHLAHDVKNQTGMGNPATDWFPISAREHVHGLGRPRPRPRASVGQPHLRLPPELRHRHGR